MEIELNENQVRIVNCLIGKYSPLTAKEISILTKMTVKEVYNGLMKLHAYGIVQQNVKKYNPRSYMFGLITIYTRASAYKLSNTELPDSSISNMIPSL